ncbi:membrane cofactor protein-like isoform X2 [Anguilla anguilla]|uniref:membrane cofactor protein-like isoform X2 n=1 Tax=Anguilla anguilla TaxID=7936 RepID=UPI0015AB0340|nr:membrane cofactor protein-like isoform X2 [Anguilla anguilla]
MFNFEDFSRHLLRLWVMALLGLALAARPSHGQSCGAPPDVLNGQWIGESILVGATMTLECNTGYTVGGKISTMQCEPGGWNGKGFVCEAVKCPLPEQILNGKSSLDVDREYLSYQESVLYTCDKSYTLSGESELRCTEKGTLNAEPPECKIVNCSQPEVKFGSQVEGRPPYVHKSFIVYKCNEGYQMKGSSKIVCEDNVWSSKPPVCEKSDASGTGSSHTEVYSALAQRVVMALLIPVGLHLSL